LVIAKLLPLNLLSLLLPCPKLVAQSWKGIFARSSWRPLLTRVYKGNARARYRYFFAIVFQMDRNTSVCFREMKKSPAMQSVVGQLVHVC